MAKPANPGIRTRHQQVRIGRRPRFRDWKSGDAPGNVMRRVVALTQEGPPAKMGNLRKIFGIAPALRLYGYFRPMQL